MFILTLIAFLSFLNFLKIRFSFPLRPFSSGCVFFFISSVESVHQLLSSELGTAAAHSAVRQMDGSLSTSKRRAHTNTFLRLDKGRRGSQHFCNNTHSNSSAGFVYVHFKNLM